MSATRTWTARSTADDVGFFQAGFDDTNQGGTLAQQLGWAVGDYNYDGTVDANDVGFFQAGFDYYNQNPNPLGGAGGVQPVPEPATSVLCLIGFAVFYRKWMPRAPAKLADQLLVNQLE